MEYLKIAATPLLLAIVGLAIVRFRKLSWTDDVGFRAPAAGAAVAWTAAFLALAVAEELFASGESARGTWLGKYDTTQIAVRIVAVGLIYPIVEEFFFRGVFLGAARQKIGTVAAVVVTSVVFGLIHTQYSWPVWIVADGLLFALCRVNTGSIYLPMLFHVLGNGYGVWERLQPAAA
ncbi:MAG TPA: CPBP family intramembrane glutamic endopeptidase [Allosphingosinicella sp.]